VLEGVALAFTMAGRPRGEGGTVGEITVTGGGARLPYWGEVLAAARLHALAGRSRTIERGGQHSPNRASAPAAVTVISPRCRLLHEDVQSMVNASATPSSTARSNPRGGVRVHSEKTPRALGSLCGVRSPTNKEGNGDRERKPGRWPRYQSRMIGFSGQAATQSSALRGLT